MLGIINCLELLEMIPTTKRDKKAMELGRKSNNFCEVTYIHFSGLHG